MTYWEILGISATTDERDIKRAYAQKLKTMDQATQLQEFRQLREAFAFARDYAKGSRENDEVYFSPSRQSQPIKTNPSEPILSGEYLAGLEDHEIPQIVKDKFEEAESLKSEPKFDVWDVINQVDRALEQSDAEAAAEFSRITSDSSVPLNIRQYFEYQMLDFCYESGLVAPQNSRTDYPYQFIETVIVYFDWRRIARHGANEERTIADLLNRHWSHEYYRRLVAEANKATPNSIMDDYLRRIAIRGILGMEVSRLAKVIMPTLAKKKKELLQGIRSECPLIFNFELKNVELPEQGKVKNRKIFWVVIVIAVLRFVAKIFNGSLASDAQMTAVLVAFMVIMTTLFLAGYFLAKKPIVRQTWAFLRSGKAIGCYHGIWIITLALYLFGRFSTDQAIGVSVCGLIFATRVKDAASSGMASLTALFFSLFFSELWRDSKSPEKIEVAAVIILGCYGFAVTGGQLFNYLKLKYNDSFPEKLKSHGIFMVLAKYVVQVALSVVFCATAAALNWILS